MKDQIGVVKEIDGLGRLVVPKEMRSLFRNTSKKEKHRHGAFLFIFINPAKQDFIAKAISSTIGGFHPSKTDLTAYSLTESMRDQPSLAELILMPGPMVEASTQDLIY